MTPTIIATPTDSIDTANRNGYNSGRAHGNRSDEVYALSSNPYTGALADAFHRGWVKGEGYAMIVDGGMGARSTL